MLCHGYEVYVSSIHENGAGAGAGGQRGGGGDGKIRVGPGLESEFSFPLRSGA